MMSAETLGSNTTTNKPKWIRVKLPTGKNYRELRSLVDKYKLNTICLVLVLIWGSAGERERLLL